MCPRDLRLAGTLIFLKGMLTAEQVFVVGVPEAPGSCRQRMGHADVWELHQASEGGKICKYDDSIHRWGFKRGGGGNIRYQLTSCSIGN